jgi:hypothetical protein
VHAKIFCVRCSMVHCEAELRHRSMRASHQEALLAENPYTFCGKNVGHCENIFVRGLGISLLRRD